MPRYPVGLPDGRTPPRSRIVRDKPELGVDRGLQAIQRDATEIGIRLNAVGILPEIVLFRVVDRIGECVLPVDTDAFHESTVQQPHRLLSVVPSGRTTSIAEVGLAARVAPW